VVHGVVVEDYSIVIGCVGCVVIIGAGAIDVLQKIMKVTLLQLSCKRIAKHHKITKHIMRK